MRPRPAMWLRPAVNRPGYVGSAPVTGAGRRATRTSPVHRAPFCSTIHLWSCGRSGVLVPKQTIEDDADNRRASSSWDG